MDEYDIAVEVDRLVDGIVEWEQANGRPTTRAEVASALAAALLAEQEPVRIVWTADGRRFDLNEVML